MVEDNINMEEIRKYWRKQDEKRRNNPEVMKRRKFMEKVRYWKGKDIKKAIEKKQEEIKLLKKIQFNNE